MAEHGCNKEAEITEIHEMLKGIDKALRGNGKPGLFTDLAVIKNTVGGLIALDVIIVIGLVSLWLGK